MRRAALSLVALLAVPVVMQAQMCVGQAPWSSGSIKAGGQVEFDGGTALTGGLGFGKDKGVFVGVAAGIATDGGTDALFGGSIGWEMKKPIADKLELCPVASVAIRTGNGATAFTPRGGISLGYPININSKNVALILTGDALIGFSRVSAGGVSATDGFGELDPGVGFILNNRISIVPQLIIPIAEEGGNVGFSVRVNVSVGKKGR